MRANPNSKYLAVRKGLFLLGSDCVCPCTATQLIRTLVLGHGGSVGGGESGTPGVQDFGAVIARLRRTQASALIHTLNGKSNPAGDRQLVGCALPSPMGELRSGAHHHVSVLVRIGRLKTDGQFEIVWSKDEMIVPQLWLGVEKADFPGWDLARQSPAAEAGHVNRAWQLEREIAERNALAAAHEQTQAGLDAKVLERTRQLEQSNSELRQEVARRKQAQEELQTSRDRLHNAQRMASIGNWEWDIQTGALHWEEENYRIFGLPPDTVPSVAAFLETIHPADLEFVREGITEAVEGRQPYDLDFRIRRADGTERVVHAYGEVERETDGKPRRFIGTVQDITARQQTEALVRSALREKEVLLKEIHHRVKNNLQIISSLLRLQSAQLDSAVAKAALQDMQDRIRSMAMIHEHLYRSDNLTEVDLPTYLESLCARLINALVATPGNIQLHLDLCPVRLEIDQAIPCGLLVSELVSNALKHAFPAGQRGELWVGLQPVAGGSGLRLRVADNGTGLPPAFDPLDLTSLGLQLVSALARQLGGRLEIGTGAGAVFEIEFTPNGKGRSPWPLVPS
ncbi:MAG: PAS domain-containing protein [Verrucomicrobia bacterium]|nr:PAS domain-containing protein [Verrucomicrobiota bacterium]